MLIFFIVTTLFVRERGLDISRPTTSPQVENASEPPMVVRTDNTNTFWVDQPVERLSLQANLERENATRPQATMLVVAHVDAMTDQLVAVLDAAKIVGIESISMATQP